MKEIFFDIKKFSYLKDEVPDVSFVPMMLRRRLDNFGRAAFYTLYNVYENNDVNLVFSSNYGDFERVEKLVGQLKSDGEVSPAGFSASVHNAVIGQFSLLEKIKTGYNAISAGEHSAAAGFLEAVLQSSDKDCLYCYTESFGGFKSVSALVSRNDNGKYRLCGKSLQPENADGFSELTEFLEGKREKFDGGYFEIQRAAV